ncbi:hypothetical protein [Mycobacteroides abscessus]|uniref:hypothetical protein n=1 Tax=Mycobacteroides abscessus TaxID=36809 RepID=UPI000D3E30F8|nr:hypothetical protein [Mycobacteroides abscessus]PVB19753.1 hypothetical protein DDJ40_08325 [Mycobacteroides abscessus]RIU40356.1 hypothetical protein D2E83_11340 [Mycobacteroides abscessus]
MIIRDVRNYGFRRTIAWYLVRVAAKIWFDEFLEKVVILDRFGAEVAEFGIVASHWGAGLAHGHLHALEYDWKIYTADYPDDPDDEPAWELW